MLFWNGLDRRPTYWPARASTVPAAPEGEKSLEKMKSALVDLQALEIARNRQRNPWKSLEEKGLDLEKLGEKAWGLGAFPTAPANQNGDPNGIAAKILWCGQE